MKELPSSLKIISGGFSANSINCCISVKLRTKFSEEGEEGIEGIEEE